MNEFLFGKSQMFSWSHLKGASPSFRGGDQKILVLKFGNFQSSSAESSSIEK